MPTAVDATRRRPVQVSATTHRWVQELAAYEHTSMSKVLERAVERYRAEVLLAAHNAAWARLAEENPQAVAAFQEEQALWDRTLADGLTEDDRGECGRQDRAGEDRHDPGAGDGPLS